MRNFFRRLGDWLAGITPEEYFRNCGYKHPEAMAMAERQAVENGWKFTLTDGVMELRDASGVLILKRKGISFDDGLNHGRRIKAEMAHNAIWLGRD